MSDFRRSRGAGQDKAESVQAAADDNKTVTDEHMQESSNELPDYIHDEYDDYSPWE